MTAELLLSYEGKETCGQEILSDRAPLRFADKSIGGKSGHICDILRCTKILTSAKICGYFGPQELTAGNLGPLE